MKKIISLVLVTAMLLAALVSCKDNVPKKLEKPGDLAISDTGLITWSASENATTYTVTVGSASTDVTGTSYQVTDLSADFNYSVVAKAAGFLDSDAAVATYHASHVPPVPETEISVAVNGKSEVCAGHKITLKAVVTGTDDKTVVWSITRGEEFATVDPISGVLTAASNVDGDQIVEVEARSLADETACGTRVITVVSRPALTQEMLNRLSGQTRMSFEGLLNISVYNFGLYDTLEKTATARVRTAMDGTNWYASYQDGNSGVDANLYYRNHDGYASQVGVSFMNDEEYSPMLDDDGRKVSWSDAGLYNCFADLTVDDFRFNDETWRYEYVGSDKTLMTRMLASANPYDFTPKNLALIIHENEIMGIYSMSEDDYTIVPGYRSVLELTVAVNIGETVDVPKISKFTHDSVHDALGKALANMRALENYTLDFQLISKSVYSSGYVISGYTETLTSGNCYFRPYTIPDLNNDVRSYTGDDYGFKKFGENEFNSYNKTETGYKAARAFAKDFSYAKPTFAVAPEIFTAYAVNEEQGTTTYYVDDVMLPAASTFYYGMGNDIQLYGIFASRYGIAGDSQSFTPYLTVKGDYITEAGFYFNLGTMFGIVEITYSNFGTATLPDGLDVNFTKREAPASWSDLTITKTGEGTTLDDDVEVNALAYFTEFFGEADIAASVPFFNNVLADTYGFGLTTRYIRTGSQIMREAVCLYYDVPLDTDYTISSSLRAIDEYLLSLGFEKNKNGEYTDGNMIVIPKDSSLDLTIYIMKVSY